MTAYCTVTGARAIVGQTGTCASYLFQHLPILRSSPPVHDLGLLGLDSLAFVVPIFLRMWRGFGALPREVWDSHSVKLLGFSGIMGLIETQNI